MPEREPGYQPEEEKELPVEDQDLDQVEGVPSEAYEQEHQRVAEQERQAEAGEE